MGNEYECRIYYYDDSNINAKIQKLYQQVFHVDIRDEFQWRFIDNPNGKMIGAIVQCKSSDEIIGHFSAMPCSVQVHGHRTDALISMGLMVDSSYAGQGIGNILAECLFNFLMERKYEFIIGFPNDVSFPIHMTKWAYTHIRDYRFVTFKNDCAEPINRYKQISIDEMGLISPYSNKGICLYRDKEYLMWRYQNLKYEIYRSSEEKYFIVTQFQDKYDILYWSDNVIEEDIKDFVHFIYHTKSINSVSTWNSISFKDKNSIIGERKYHFCIKKLKNGLSQDIFSSEDWFWLMGDSELF